MSNYLFPTNNLPGLTWNYTLSDVFDIVHYPSATPGFENVLSKSSDPTFKLKLEYEFLRENAPSNIDELAIIKSFYRLMQGSYDSFLLDMQGITKNPKDSVITGQVIVPDANGFAPLIRTYGGVPETIYEVNVITQVRGTNNVNVMVVIPPKGGGYVNVNATAGNYTYWTSTGQRTYAGVAYPGVVIEIGPTALTDPFEVDFSWFYRMRFEKDQNDIDAFMSQLYELKEIDMVTRRNP